MRQRRLDDPERRIDVGLHRRVEILGRHVEDRVARLLAAGIADDDVEAAESLDRAADQIRAEFLVAQIAGDGEPVRPRP